MTLAATPAGAAASPVAAVPVLEIGGTHATAALVDGTTGAISAAKRVEVDAAGDAAGILDAWADAARALTLLADVDAATRWGVAMPGPFDYAAGIGRFVDVGKFESLTGVDVRDGLGARLPGATFAFVNDADAFALGEATAGAGRGIRRLVGVTLGTGVGSGFIADGHPVVSGDGLPEDGELHFAEWRGSPIEDHFSRRALRAAFAGRGGDPDADVREIVTAARAGDATAVEILTAGFTALGGALAPWLRAFGAEAVVVGGSVARSWDVVGPLLVEALDAAGTGHLPVRPAVLDDAGAVGAAVIAARG